MKKKDIKDFLDSKKTYKKVLNILSEKAGCSIAKKKGTTIAGGSVANVLFSMIHGGEPVVRDIDVFEFDDRDKGKGRYNRGWVEPTNPEFPIATDIGMLTQEDTYGNQVVRPNGDFILMLSHTRDGIFNNIKVYVGSRGAIPNRSETLLNGFDINACQAGLDFKNKRITYTDEFVDFLHGRQLRITIPVNPIQTIIRLKKKIEDLDCYCNLDYEVSILKHSCLVSNTSRSFGEETYEKYVKDEEFLNKHFIITPYKEKVFDFDTMDSFTDGASDLKMTSKETDRQLYRFEPILDSYIPPYVFRYPIELLNYFRLMDGSTGGGKIRKFNRVMDHITSFGVDDRTKHVGYINERTSHLSKINLSVPHMFESKEVKKLRKQKVLTVSHPMWGFLSSLPNYCDCDFDVKHIQFITDFTKEHRGLSGVVYKSDDLTIQSHYKLLKSFKSIANKRGDWIIGELENMSNEIRDELNKSDNKIEWLNDYLDKAEEKLSRKLTDPLDLSDFEHKDCVTEITNNLDLLSEGRRMGHCVGGYGSKIENGSSRIFHIDCDGIGSTVEVGFGASIWPKFGSAKARKIDDEWIEFASKEDIHNLRRLDGLLEKSGYTNRQHYGRYPEKGNKTPTETNQSVVAHLVSYLNDTHMEKAVKELLWERHQLEEKIRKTVYEGMIDSENRKKAEKARELGDTVVAITDHGDWGRDGHTNMPQQRFVPVDDIW